MHPIMRIALCLLSSFLVVTGSLPGAAADEEEEWSETQDYIATGLSEDGTDACDDPALPPSASFDLSGVADDADYVAFEFDDDVFGVPPFLLCVDGQWGQWHEGTMEEQYYYVAVLGSAEQVDVYVAQSNPDPRDGGLGTTGTVTATTTPTTY